MEIFEQQSFFELFFQKMAFITSHGFKLMWQELQESNFKLLAFLPEKYHSTNHYTNSITNVDAIKTDVFGKVVGITSDLNGCVHFLIVLSQDT